MHIVVTGATGFIGTPLIRALLAAGNAVTALTRNVDHATRRLPARCNVRPWNAVGDLDPTAVRGADAVINLAGEGIAEARWTAERRRVIRESRVQSSLAVVRALEQLEPNQCPSTLVSASAIGWYGERGDAVLDEDSSRGAGFLAEVCEAWEAAAFRAQALNVRTVAVRIGIVLGKDGGALDKLLPVFRLGLGGRVGSGRQWMSWIHLDDLVALLQFVLENSRAVGIVNGVAPQPVTNAQFTSALARVLRRPALLPVPASALRVFLGEMSSLVLASQRVQPRAAERMGFVFRFPALLEALHNLCDDPAHELVSEQWLAHPPERVFRFFSDPANLEKITPAFVHFRVRRATTPQLREGTLIDYALRLHGIPVRWQSRIDSYEPNRAFVDVQTRGPYRLWQHIHEFEPADGGTVVRDRVRYQLPFGALGDVVAGRLVRRDLAAIFEFRRARLPELIT